MTRKVTSGGKESGALPIFEWQDDVVEKREVCCCRCGIWAKAGTRKDGRVTSRVNGVAIESAFARLRDERAQCNVVAIEEDVDDQLCCVADVYLSIEVLQSHSLDHIILIGLSVLVVWASYQNRSFTSALFHVFLLCDRIHVHLRSPLRIRGIAVTSLSSL